MKVEREREREREMDKPEGAVPQVLRLVGQRGVDADVLKEPGHPSRWSVFGGFVRPHQRHPVVEEDVHGVLRVE